jgi:hypothetical protein
MEKELHESINFLDLTIHRKDRNVQFSIYRNPTQTDIIVPTSSCHPYEHKLSGIMYLLNRLHVYPKTKKVKDTKMNIKNMLHNNEYNTNRIEKPPPSQKQNTQ